MHIGQFKIEHLARYCQIRSKKMDIIEILFKNRNNYTPNYIREFIQNIDIDKDEKGMTALMTAVNENAPEIVQILIDSGVNLDIQNNDGYTK